MLWLDSGWSSENLAHMSLLFCKSAGLLASGTIRLLSFPAVKVGCGGHAQCYQTYTPRTKSFMVPSIWRNTMMSIIPLYCPHIILSLQLSKVLSYSLKVDVALLLTLSILLCYGYDQFAKGYISAPAYITSTLGTFGNVSKAEPPHIHIHIHICIGK